MSSVGRWLNPRALIASALFIAAAATTSCAPKFNFSPSINVSSISKACTPSGSYQLAFTTEPSSSISAGQALPVGGVIEAQDSCGNLVTTGALSSATVSLSDASQNGSISGVSSVTLAGGIATIPNNTLIFEKTGAAHLAAQAAAVGYGTLSVTSNPIAIGSASFSSVSGFSGPDDPNGTVDGTGTASARLWDPSAVTSDGTNVYLLENFPNCVMREYSIASGAVTTLAGQLYNCGYTDGALGTNTLGKNFVNGGVAQMATDGTYVYFADGNSIRRVTISDGSITTIAGSPTTSGYLDNTTGTSARFGSIGGLYINGSTLYVGAGCYIRAVDIGASPYAVSTIAGSGTCGVVDNGSPLSAELKDAGYFAADSTNLYFTDNSATDIRQMAWTGGAITTDATALNNSPCGGASVESISVVGSTLYFACQDMVKAATIGTWTWSTVAGRSWYGGEVDGAAGTSLIAAYDLPSKTSMYANGTDIYFGDSINGALRILDTSTNQVTTLAGTPNAGTAWIQNTSAANSRFEQLQDLVSDGTNLYSADFGSNLLPVIAMSDGATAPPVGTGWGFNVQGNQVLSYMGGKLYYADSCEIWEIDPVALTRTALVGSSTCAELEGGFSSAEFSHINAIASDQQNLYVSDNNAIKKLDFSTQTVSVLSGLAGTSGCVTGSASASRYNGVGYMTYMNGNLYFTEYCNHDAIVQVNTTTGASSIIAGNGTFGYVNGALTGAEFGGAGYDYHGLPITSDGQNLYIYDAPDGAIRQVSISGNSVTTLFGSTSERWDLDGPLATARESAFTAANAIYYGYGKLYIVNGRGVRVVQ